MHPTPSLTPLILSITQPHNHHPTNRSSPTGIFHGRDEHPTPRMVAGGHVTEQTVLALGKKQTRQGLEGES